MCLDIGHDRRNGKDPVADLEKYISRVFDIHLKDVTGASKAGYSVEVGRGILDIPGFVRMLRKPATTASSVGARTQHEGSVHRNCRIHRLFQGRGSHNERQTKIKDNFILSLSRKGLCSDANAIPFFYDI